MTQRVFFLHPDLCWTVGELLGEDDQKKGEYVVKCEATKETLTVPKTKLYVCRGAMDKDASDDLLSLTELHPAILLSVLKNRFLSDVVYTYIGDLVIAVNPFKFTIPWYQDDQMELYLKEGERIVHCKPHSWAVANTAYYAMLKSKLNQSILISGESGAGKTEGCKIVIKYLCALSSLRADEKMKTKTDLINQRVQQTSPILEAFGNAKTVRNDNSSRFGKFMQVQFDTKGVLVGMRIVPYLLEKSRVIQAGPDERVYHSFYQLLNCSNHELRTRLRLTNMDDFRSLNSGRCLRIAGVSDGKDFDDVVEAMNGNGFTQDDQDFIWRTLAAILHLQNIEFVVSKEDSGRAAIPDKWKDTIEFVAKELLMIENVEVFKLNFISYSNVVMKETVIKYLNHMKAADTRDTVCRVLYERLFHWIVSKINIAIQSVDSTPAFWIGLLDIFGFEDFETNSFEQYCINLTNETLQRHYTKHTFDKDKSECEKESIDCQSIRYIDNQPCLSLMSDPKKSIMAILDESSTLDLERAKEDPNITFLAKITNKYMPDYQSTNKKAKISVLDRQAGEMTKDEHFFYRGLKDQWTFTVRHYAGDVQYSVKGFVEKNIESIKDSLRGVLRSSKDARLSAMFSDESSRKGTVASSFRQNLKELVEMIESTQPQWIRCIRPHPSKKPNSFDPKQVLEQLTAAGVMETVQMRQQNFPFRMKFEDFWRRYSIIVDKRKFGNMGANCRGIIEAVKMFRDQIQVGLTKVFMLNKAYSTLEQLRTERLQSHAVVVQRWGWCRLGKRVNSYLRWKRAAVKIQRCVRIWLWIRHTVRDYYAHLTKLRNEKHSRQQGTIIAEEKHIRDSVGVVQKKQWTEIMSDFWVQFLPMLDRLKLLLQDRELEVRGRIWREFVIEREQLKQIEREAFQLALRAYEERQIRYAQKVYAQRVEFENETKYHFGNLWKEEELTRHALAEIWAPIEKDIFRKAARIHELNAKRSQKIDKLARLHQLVQAEEERSAVNRRRIEARMYVDMVGGEQLQEDISHLMNVMPPEQCNRMLNTFLDHGGPTQMIRDTGRMVGNFGEYCEDWRRRYDRDRTLLNERRNREAQAQRRRQEEERQRVARGDFADFYAGSL